MAKKNTKTQAPKFESINRVEMTGRVCENGILKSKGTVRFSMGHNLGPKADTLFLNVVMFPKNGKKELKVPEELIVKGAALTVKGYLKSDNRTFTDKSGAQKTFRQLVLVALSIEPTNIKAEQPEQPAAQEA